MKFVVHGAVVLSLLLGAAAVADALVVTDQERLDAFAEALSGVVEVDQIDEGLAYVDLEHEPLLLTTPDGEWEFGRGDGADLGSRVRDALAPYMGSSVDEVQRSVEIDGEEARVAVRLRTPEGLLNATFDLAKSGERWFVHRARLR